MNIVNVRHQVAKHRTAAAARGLGAMRHFFVKIDEAVLRVNRCGIDLPINLHRDQFIDRIN